MGRVAILVALGGACLGLAAAACVSLSGLSGAPPPGPDAGPDVVVVTMDAAPVDPCRHTTVPPEPAKDDDPAGEVAPVVVAIREISLTGALDGGVPTGYDLDGVCTCFPDPTTAHGGSPSCVPPNGSMPACDSDGGADRQLGSLFAGYPDFFNVAATANRSTTLLMKVTKYNGRANDSEVFVAILASQGIYDASGCSAADAGAVDPDAGSAPYPPTWKGCDLWTVDGQYVLPGTTEPTSYLPAYVTDHVLVVRPSAKPVRFLAGNVALPISGAVITARLVAVDAQLAPIVPAPDVGQRFRFEEGVVAGRTLTTDALRAIAASQAVSNGGPLCGFTDLFTAVKTMFICPNADITGSPSNDFTNAPCDAISLAVAFGAEPAQLGVVRPADPTSCEDPNADKFKALFDCAQ